MKPKRGEDFLEYEGEIWISMREAREIISRNSERQVSANSIRLHATREKKIRFHKFGRSLFFPLDEVEKTRIETRGKARSKRKKRKLEERELYPSVGLLRESAKKALLAIVDEYRQEGAISREWVFLPYLAYGKRNQSPAHRQMHEIWWKAVKKILGIPMQTKFQEGYKILLKREDWQEASEVIAESLDRLADALKN